MKRIASLDGLRAISIILVLLSHSRFSAGFPNQLTAIVSHFAVGVTVFFVISGFLITTLLLNEQAKYGSISLNNFYVRRALRILPVFLLYLLFVTLWRNIENIGITNSNIVHALTFTINFSFTRLPWSIAHFWTLSVEEQFYITWPALLIIFRKHLKPLLLILICYSCVVRAISLHYPTWGIVLLTPYFKNSDAISIGALGAILLFENPGLVNKKLFESIWLKFLALGIIVLFVWCVDQGEFSILAIPLGNSIISISILFLVLSYIKPSDSPVYKLLNSKVAVHIGILSYSLYIWQQFFFWGPGFPWRTFPYNLAVIYIVAMASYNLWEQPFLTMKKKYFNGSPAAVLQ